MRCSNCGAELKEEARFCALCGQKVEEVKAKAGAAEAVQAEAVQPESAQNEAVQPEPVLNEATQNEAVQPEVTQAAPEKPKKKLGFKIGIAAIVIAVIAVGAVGGAAAYKAIRKAMMSTTEYYQYVEQKNRDEGVETFMDSYDMLRSNMQIKDKAQKTSMKFRISDTAKSLLSLSGIDFSKLGDVELVMEESQKDAALSAQCLLKLDKESLISSKIYANTEEKEFYIQVPELTESYLDLSGYLEENNYSAIMDLSKVDNYLPKTSDINAVLTRYTDIVIKNAKNVKEAEKTIEAKKISQKVTEYTVNINEKNGIKLCEDILKTAKEDKNIKNIIEVYSDEVYSDYQAGVAEMLEALKEGEAGDEDILTLKTYVDNDDVIVGREITIPEEDIVIKEICPRDDEKFGYELSVAEGETTYFTLSGSGEEESDVINGEYTVGIDESLMASSEIQLASYDEIVKIVVKDYDKSNISEGEGSGTYTISTEVLPQLANYSLKMEFDMDGKNAKNTIGIMAGKDELAAVELTVSESKALKDIKPSNSATIYDVKDKDDMTAYEAEISLETFVEKLEEKTGISFNSLFGSLTSSNEEAIDPYDMESYDNSANEDISLYEYSGEELDYSDDALTY